MCRMVATLGAFALLLTGTSVQSAPPGSSAGELRSAAQAGSGHHRVAYRLCWRAGGVRQCRWVDNARIYGYRAPGKAAPRVYGYTALPAVTVSPPPAPAIVYGAAPVYNYVPPPAVVYPPGPRDWSNPDLYPTGSRSWWRVLDHEAQQGSGGP